MLRSSRTAFLATLACAAALLVAGLIVRFVDALQARDMGAVGSFGQLDGPGSSGPLRLIASVGNPLPYALLGLGLVLIAYLRGRTRVAIAIAILLVATGAVTEGLKLLLEQGTLKPGSFPSGHATAALTLGLCAVLAAPARLRPIVAVAGAVLAAAVSCAIVSLGRHTPSDVLGGLLVAATLTGAAVTVLLRGEERRGERERERRVAAQRFDPVPAAVAGSGF